MTFSEARFPRMLSLSVTIGLIGAIYGGGPVSYLRESFGYQTVLEALVVTGVLLALMTYWIVPNIKSTPQSTIISDIKDVLGNKYVICSCAFAGLMVGPLEGFADVWGTSFLKQVYGFNGALAASLPSLIFIGMCFGGPLLSLISERIGSSLGTIVSAGVIMAISFFLLLAWHLTSGMLSLNFIIVGVCCAYQILAIYKASTYVPEHVAGLTTAVANMIIMIFGYVFHATIGSIVNVMGGPNSSEALAYGVAIIPIALCIGTTGFVFLFIKELQEQRKTPIEIKVFK
jgi:hypothetical protein